MKSITVQQLHEVATTPLIDVREVHEYEAGHIAGAVNIPFSTWRDRVEEFPKEPFHVICELGGRSASVARKLDAAGYDVTDVEGGTAAWIEQGFPVEH
ncbi:rhodanese-like domain-containing protein [Microbacterium horticulturae]|uniref:Rhodanese-like domain-containing protein n=1 Tax=Microbacterium horticulturae TaxID=3028316 RepID=A0ABY8BZK1_9MICO|nr:rhodanese-like domain-containing protein [Microbacterium sp. KACC 23027]WEG09626.1 rhodanese-like domain-containing protein [Microbacterium sp. KACC 23027]